MAAASQIEREAAIARITQGVGGQVMRHILGDELTALGESTLGLGSYKFFLLFLTLASGLACCSLCIMARLVRAAVVRCCFMSRRAKALALARKASRKAGAIRVASDDFDQGEEDQILGDDK